MSKQEKKALLAKLAKFNALKNAEPVVRRSTESIDYSKVDFDKVIEMAKYGYDILPTKDEVLPKPNYTIETYFDRRERRMLKRLNLIDDEDN